MKQRAQEDRRSAAERERALRLVAGLKGENGFIEGQPSALPDFVSLSRGGTHPPLSPAFSKVARWGDRALSGLVKLSTEMLEFAEAEMSNLIEGIDRLGHRLWVESVPGLGSTLYFTVAAADDRPQGDP